jgi:1-acyl-sn-glycerol-3-phosphate acyltransferase
MVVKIRKFKKIISFALFMTSYMTTSLFIHSLCLFSFKRSRKYLIKNISRHTKFGLYLLDIKLKTKIANLKTNQNYLIVCNHLSYLDIFVISSVFPACFVTSYEMKETPFLGQVCSLGGCLFVERRSKKGLSNEIINLTNALKENMNVVIFPEATSGNGEGVLKFRSPLFQAAIEAKREVLPLCLNYLTADNEPVTLKNRDSLFWYGDMTFFSHFLKLIELKTIEIELSVLEVVQLDTEKNKAELAQYSFEKINSTYLPIQV